MAQTADVCTAIMDGYMMYFGSPTPIIYGHNPGFMAILAQYLFWQFCIKLLAIHITNFKSLLSEHGIKSLGYTLTKHLSVSGCVWDHFLGFAMLNIIILIPLPTRMA